MSRFLRHIERFLDSSGLLNLIVLLFVCGIGFGGDPKGLILILMLLVIVPVQYKLWKSFMEGLKKAYIAQIVTIYLALILIVHDAIQLLIYGPYSLIHNAGLLVIILGSLGVAPGWIFWLIHLAVLIIDPSIPFRYEIYFYAVYVAVIAVYAALISYYVWCKLKEKQ